MNKASQLPKGHTSILSPEFKYVPAVSTDLAETFARIRGQRPQVQLSPSPMEPLDVAGNAPVLPAQRRDGRAAAMQGG